MSGGGTTFGRISPSYFFLELLQIVHAPCKGPCCALRLVAKVSAVVPLQSGAVVAQLRLHKQVLPAHAVANKPHTLVAAMLLSVAQTKVYALCHYGVGLCIDAPTIYPQRGRGGSHSTELARLACSPKCPHSA